MICNACQSETDDGSFCMNCGTAFNNGNSNSMEMPDEPFATARDVERKFYGEAKKIALDAIGNQIVAINRSIGKSYDGDEPKKRINPFKEMEQEDRNEVLTAISYEINELLKEKDIGGRSLENFKVMKMKETNFETNTSRHPSHKFIIAFEVVNKSLIVMYR